MSAWIHFTRKTRLIIFLTIVGVASLLLSAPAAPLSISSIKPYPPNPPPGLPERIVEVNSDVGEILAVDKNDRAQEKLVQPDDVIYLMYIPIVFNQENIGPPSTLKGRVTYKGISEAFTNVELAYFNGIKEVVYDTTVTDAGGNYQFDNLPSLSGDQYYYVRKINYEADPNWLYSWYCTRISATTSDPDLFECDFDFENVILIYPLNKAGIYLPETFTWKKRITVTDSYVFNLIDPSNKNTFFDSNPLGYSDSFYLAGTPSGFTYYKQYEWWVTVRGSNGEGKSHYAYIVTFY